MVYGGSLCLAAYNTIFLFGTMAVKQLILYKL